MSVLTANPLLITDGDVAFLRVNNRKPVHALEPGEVAGARNQMLDQGKPRPRLGVALDYWGRPPGVAGETTTTTESPGDFMLDASGNPILDASGQPILQGPTSTSTTITTPDAGGGPPILDASGQPILDANGQPILQPGAGGSGGGGGGGTPGRGTAKTCAYKRFSDPTTDTDNCILLTDDWRDGAGEDGGRGRAWRIRPGNVPQLISLNGHDIWGPARLIQCHNAMVLLRHGNELHYFTAADVNDDVNDQIQLHVALPWPVGEARRMRFELASDGAAIYGSAPPAAGNYYYAKHIFGNKVELYTDAALTNKLDYDLTTPPNGRFSLELAIDPIPYFGNGAPPLIMQPNESSNAFELGFMAVTADVEITDTSATSGIITAGNHRLTPGDQVDLDDIGGLTTGYVYPRSEHTFVVYATELDALADSGTVLLPASDGDTGSVRKTSAAGLPMPSGREGIYYKGRLILINGQDLLLISDPFDFLHFTLFVGEVAANLGESGQANWLLSLGEDTLLIGKSLAILAITGLSGDSSGWRMDDVTREYGGIAPLAALNVGTDAWLLSRKGVASVQRTVAGEKLGVARTVSHNIPEDLKLIDWWHAGQSCAEIWNNRFFLAAPLKQQDDPENPVNNRLFVFNFLNQFLNLSQGDLSGEMVGRINETDSLADGWEGYWDGDLLKPHSFAKLTVAGEERLTFATPDGQVCWLHDGWDDVGQEIPTELVTRGYFGGRLVLALKGAVVMDTFRPRLTIKARTAGYKEEVTLVTAEQYDRTKYVVDGQADYDPTTATVADFERPRREDYSTTPEELLIGELDVHQNSTRNLRMRIRDRAVQLVIINSQGSARINAVTIQARPAGMGGTRQT